MWQPDQKGVTWHWQSWRATDGSLDWGGVTTDLNAMHQAGITWARVHVGPDVSNEVLDRLLTLAHSRGVHFLALVADTQALAKEEPPEWLYSLSSRYADRIGAWEIGNEENNSEFWSIEGGALARAQRYVDYLHEADASIKKANPKALVLMGGLMGWHVEEFLSLFSRLGGGAYTDGFNIHPYANSPVEVRARLQAIEDVVAKDPLLKGKPVWVTEIGFYANEPTWKTPSRVPDEAAKAKYLTRTMEGLRAAEISTPIFWYNFHDSEPGVCGYSLVLFDRAGREVALPAYWAYQRLAPAGPGKPPAELDQPGSTNARCP